MHRALITLSLLLVACGPDPEPDCEASTFQMDYGDGLPTWSLDLHSTDGLDYDVVLDVSWLGEGEERASCD